METEIIKDTPKISIGMPIYNGGALLRQAIESLLSQTFTDFELLISENQSDDESYSVCLEYQKRDSRIVLYRQQKNVRAIENFSFVLEKARAPYFMFCAHDDVREPRFLECLIGNLEEHPGAVLSFCKFDNIDQAERQVRTFEEDWGKVFSGSIFKQYLGMILLDESKSQKANFYYGLMKRSIIIECFQKALVFDAYSGHDVLMLFYMLAKGDFIVHDEVLFHYRVRSLVRKNKEPFFRYLKDRFCRYSKEHRGNVLLFFVRYHNYFRGLRSVISDCDKLNCNQKYILKLLTIIREVKIYVLDLFLSVWRELFF